MGGFRWKRAGCFIDGLAYISDGFTAISFKGLQLDENNAKYLGKILATNKTLKALDLRKCNIRKDNLELICSGLEKNDTLIHLNLDNNILGVEGGEIVGKLLKHNTAIASLYLAETKLLDTGGAHILSGISNNESVLIIDVRYSEIFDHNINDSIDEILDRNYALKKESFKNSIDLNEKVPWKRSKLMIVGEGCAGKSATARSLLDKKFVPTWNSTIGIALSKTQATINSSGAWEKDRNTGHDSNLAMQLIMKNHAKNRNPGVESRSGSNSKKKKRKLPRVSKTKTKEPLSKVLPTEKKEDIISKLDSYTFVEAESEGDSINFSIWDYGGQEVFYALHHLFLSDHGIYLVVFDMRTLSNDQGSKSLDYIKYWLQSIKLHAPGAPILIVGTFKDMVDFTDIQLINERFSEQLQLETTISQVVKNDKDGLLFFPLSNKTSDGIDSIRSEIFSCARSGKFMNQMIPLRWISCFDSIMETYEGQNWINMAQVRDLAAQYNISSVDLDEMLKFLNSVGLLTYFTSTTSLREVVTLSPQWLIDSISKVIRDDRLHNARLAMNSSRVYLENEVKHMFQTGLLSRDVAEYIWRGETDFFLDLMRSLLLLSDWEHEREKKFFIPSLLFNKTKGGVLNDKLLNIGIQEWNKNNGNTLSIDFPNGFLPAGIFERLLCVFLSYVKRSVALDITTHTIGYRSGSKSVSIHFNDGSFVRLQEHHTSIEAYIQDDLKPATYLQFFISILKKVNADVFSSSLLWKVKLQTKDENFISYAEAEKKSVKPWFHSPLSREQKVDPLSRLNEMFG